MITEGTKAPNFTLNDKDGKSVSLSDFIGKKVILYFYPKDNTPGCTRQACAFSGAYDDCLCKSFCRGGTGQNGCQDHRATKRNRIYHLI